MDENMQPESLPQQEVKQPEPPLVQDTKIPKRNLTVIILGVFLAVLCVAVAGLGFWAYKLNSNLAETQQKLATLQTEHTKLQSDYEKLKSGDEKLTADLKQTKTDLEKTNGELTTAQADLKKSQNQSQELQTKIGLASKKMAVLDAAFNTRTVNDFLAVDTMIKATNDKDLLTQWNLFALAPSTDNSVKFFLYLIGSIRDDLK